MNKSLYNEDLENEFLTIIYTEGLVKKVSDKWRVVSGKTGKLWPQTYDTKELAEKALKAYWVHKKGK